MPDYLLDTSTASRIMRMDRKTIAAMRRSNARSVSISSVSQSELLFGAHKLNDHNLMAKVRHFLSRTTVHDWGTTAAELHAAIRAQQRSARWAGGPYDLMIVAHAVALGHVLVSSDKAISRLTIDGLRIVEW